MRFLVDENTADSVGRYLAECGHEVLYAREVLAISSPDQLLAFTADTQGLIVVTHDKDFRRLSKLLPGGYQRRFERGAGRICLLVKENQAVSSLRNHMDEIEFHYAQAIKYHRRFLLSITATGISVITNSSRQ